MKKPNKALFDKMISGSKEERIFLSSKSFALFFSYYFLESIQYPFAPFHLEWFDKLDKIEESKELHLIAFRESAKSTIAQAFLVYCILNNLRKYIIVDSYSKENAERTLFNVILTFQTNERIKSDYGIFYTTKRDVNEISKKTISNFITDNGIRVEASSTQESLRGRLHQTTGGQKYRPDLWFRDDIETSVTLTDKMTQNIKEHLLESTGGLDANAWIITLGNYISEYGVIQEIINTRDNVYVQSILDRDETPSWKAKYALSEEEAQKTGKISIEALKARIANSTAWSADYLCKPIDTETAVFKPHLWANQVNRSIALENTDCYISIDPAMTVKETSDYTGITVGFMNMQGITYIESWHERIDPKDFMDLIFNLYFRYRNEGKEPKQIGIEEGIFYKAIHPFFKEECIKRGVYPPVVGISHQNKRKEDRIIANLLYRYETGAIKHIENKNKDLEEEMIRFPNSEHDDIHDSTSQLFNIIRPPEFIQKKKNPFDSLYTEDMGQIITNTPLWQQ